MLLIKKSHIFVFILVFIINNKMIYSGNSTKFVCKSGEALIDRKLICNGHIDCYDKSDEINELCSRIVCSSNMFRCHCGACINQFKKCNGIIDCPDQSDETQCGRILNSNSCALNEFRCKCGQCILSILICNGSPDCVDGSDEIPEICQHNYLCPWKTFRCKYGGCVPISSQCNGTFDCLDESDESNELCNVSNHLINSCPPIISKRLKSMCQYNNSTKVPCNQKQLPGTIVEYSCKKYYVIKYEWDINNIINECQSDGRWFRPILTCIPNYNHFNYIFPLKLNVTKAFPWHVNLFIKEYNNNYYKYQCGATLISETHVITAAHCVWEQKYELINLIIDTSSYKVQHIFIHPLYFDKYGNYGSDIAIINLIGFVKFSNEILPISFDCNFNLQLSESISIIMGIYNNNNQLNSTMNRYKLIRLNVVSAYECLQSNLLDFWKFITISTFCAGWKNGSELCNGDSGNGLIFSNIHSNQWCLQGIVSLSSRIGTSLRCNPMSYTIFTNISLYVQWINNILADVP